MREATPRSIPKGSWLVAAITGAGAFMAMLDSTVVNLALESIRADFFSTLSLAQWVATGYLCALAISLPAAAWLGARFGYGRVWRSSLGLFIGASMLCAVAPNMATLIGARFLQGLAGGLMVPAGQAVIGSTVDKQHLGRIFGWLGLVVALGPTVGPGMGGFLLESTSWRGLFWINVPIGVAALVAARNLVPYGSTNADRKLDRTGLALLSVGLPLLLFGATQIGFAEVTPLTILAASTGIVLATIFWLTTLHASDPLIDFRLLERGTFSTATVMSGLTGASMYGGILLVPLYLQLVANQSPVETGLWLLVMGIGSALALPVAGTLIDRYGAGFVALTGSTILMLGTVPFVISNSFSPVALGAILAARGGGVALAQMPAMTAAFSSVSSEEMGDAATLVNIVQRIGGALGAVGVVVIIQRAGGTSSHTAYIDAFAFLAVLSVATLIAAALMHRQIQSRDLGGTTA